MPTLAESIAKLEVTIATIDDKLSRPLDRDRRNRGIGKREAFATVLGLCQAPGATPWRVYVQIGHAVSERTIDIRLGQCHALPICTEGWLEAMAQARTLFKSQD
jgi:hypothetical protein